MGGCWWTRWGESGPRRARSGRQQRHRLGIPAGWRDFELDRALGLELQEVGTRRADTPLGSLPRVSSTPIAGQAGRPLAGSGGYSRCRPEADANECPLCALTVSNVAQGSAHCCVGRVWLGGRSNKLGETTSVVRRLVPASTRSNKAMSFSLTTTRGRATTASGLPCQSTASICT